MNRKEKTPQQQTTSSQLSSLIKSCRDIMRKDKGLNGDSDRLPMLTWIMFLKFLDDMEMMRETENKMEGTKYSPALRAPYRWRDWAAREDGITGEGLISFINNEECVRPDGSRGPGLFAYLRTLEGSGQKRDRRNVVAIVFRGTANRMLNGYLLRDVINKINRIHFTSTEEIHTLSHLYESLLKEMRDASGDAGEYYTPRGVVKFMVEAIDPRLGETVLDPACGTGGFLVEAFEHIKKQCRTVEDHKKLQGETIYGGEAKSLPYLLCQMNLLLHSLDAPSIDPGNSLRFSLKEIGDKDRVDVVLTNPPFGGEEEKGIQGNFPQDKQTGDTALLFLQLIMRKLARPAQAGKKGGRGGRAAVVVPNGTLFGDGVCARIKEELLKEFNLHTVVRLPNGVFSPYTSIPTNILFFDRTGPTKETWFYGHPLPEGKKNYTKTKPIQFEEFKPCLGWWKNREENAQAWKVKAEEVLKYDNDGDLVSANLDIKNPKELDEFEHMEPGELVEEILEKENKIIEIITEIKKMVDNK
jgi:type I restriction enzyme M protein